MVNTDELCKLLDELICKMMACTLEDFGINVKSSSELNVVESLDDKTVMISHLLLGSYEILIEHLLIKENFHLGNVNLVSILFKKYILFYHLMKENMVDHVTGKHIIDDGKLTSYLSTNGLISMGRLLIAADISPLLPLQPEIKSALRQLDGFVRYILTVIYERTHQLSEVFAEHPEDTFQQSCSYAHILLNTISEPAGVCSSIYSIDQRQPKVGRPLSSMAIEAYSKLIEAIYEYAPSQLFVFLEIISFNSSAFKEGLSMMPLSDLPDLSSHQKLLYHHLKLYQKLTEMLLLDRSSYYSKECQQLILMMNHMVMCTEESQTLTKYLHAWCQNVCSKHTLDDISLTRLFTHMVFDIDDGRDLTCLQNVSQDIYRIFGNLLEDKGDVPQPIITTTTCHYPIVNVRTSTVTIQNIAVCLEREISLMEWVVDYVQLSKPLRTEQEFQMKDSLESLLLHRLIQCSEILDLLIQTAIPIQQCESVLKSITLVYRLLTLCVKKVTHVSLITNLIVKIPFNDFPFLFRNFFKQANPTK
jgi:hypothetical protein